MANRTQQGKKQFQEDTISGECSDLEESGAVQISSTNSQGKRINHAHTVINPNNSQGSSSSFSPFSSPVSSPRSESTDCKLSTNGTVLRQSSNLNSGTFLHPGTSNTLTPGDRERSDRTARKKQYFIHPSTSENVRNNQVCTDSTLISSVVQDTCPGQRIQPHLKAGTNTPANLLKKLMSREIRGVVRKNPANPRDPQVRLFTRLPARLAFCLRDAIPHSAIENGHIFLGFSKCGQFLLSYTQ